LSPESTALIGAALFIDDFIAWLDSIVSCGRGFSEQQFSSLTREYAVSIHMGNLAQVDLNSQKSGSINRLLGFKPGIHMDAKIIESSD
jgi:hypothetical protein